MSNAKTIKTVKLDVAEIFLEVDELETALDRYRVTTQRAYGSTTYSWWSKLLKGVLKRFYE